eukprot:13699235-Alexandrium_andersonii.AAC.1
MAPFASSPPIAAQTGGSAPFSKPAQQIARQPRTAPRILRAASSGTRHASTNALMARTPDDMIYDRHNDMLAALRTSRPHVRQGSVVESRPQPHPTLPNTSPATKCSACLVPAYKLLAFAIRGA